MSSVIQFAFFHALFFTCMWLSKTLHPLFFEQAHRLENFGLSYSAMALAGYFSFLIGHYCDRLGHRWSLSLGCGLYGAGLFLRIYPDSALISVVSGLVGGLGASAALSSARVWMLLISNNQNRSQVIGIKNSMTALGTALGCAAAGVLSGRYLNVDMEVLLKCSGLLMMGLAITPFFLRKSDQETCVGTQNKEKLFAFFLQNKQLATWTLVIGAFAGFYVSFISPYLPVILKSKGFDLTTIGLSTGALALVRFVVDPFIGRWMENKKEQSFRIYLISEAVVLIATAAFLSPYNETSFILFLLLRSLGLGFSTLSEEITWFRIFPKESIGLCFGLNQSGFFIGDFIGGLINGKIFAQYGMQGCALVALLIMIANATVFSIFVSGDSKKSAVTGVGVTS